MSVIFSSEELTATDRSPVTAPDLGLVSLGAEFAWDGADRGDDLSDLECQPLLVSDLPMNSELQGMPSASQQ